MRTILVDSGNRYIGFITISIDPDSAESWPDMAVCIQVFIESDLGLDNVVSHDQHPE